ncbi:NADH-cytochrome b5 reductase [Bulinus truncatus]|nr:NADH-cytochrome b5 reductase [Bulinus truncatus]
MSVKLFPLLRPHARVVNLSTMMSQVALKQCSDQLKARFTDPKIPMEELTALINQFVKESQTGSHKEAGWPNFAYGVSKIGVTVMSMIQQRELDAQGADDIVVNACCPGYVNTDMSNHQGHLTIDQGAESPVYCALLPPNTNQPRGKFISVKKVVEWKDGLSFQALASM